MTGDRLYLLHISECIRRVTRHAASGRDAFLAEEVRQDAVLRNLQVMSESTQRLSTALKAAHPAIDWRRIAAFRNLLAHDYLGVDMRLIWDVMEQDIPPLAETIAAMLEATDR